MKQFFVLLVTFALACQGRQNSKLVSVSENGRGTAHAIAIVELRDNFKSLNRRYVQTSGVLWYEFENVSICERANEFENCFWLTFDSLSTNNDSLLTSLSGRKVTIRGIIDTSSKGHMGAYLATLKNVDFLVAN